MSLCKLVPSGEWAVVVFPDHGPGLCKNTFNMVPSWLERRVGDAVCQSCGMYEYCVCVWVGGWVTHQRGIPSSKLLAQQTTVARHTVVAVQGANSSHNITILSIASVTVLKMGMATVANYKPNKVQTLPQKL